MPGHSNRSMAHGFYYRGVDRGESREYRGCTVSYRGRTAYSYATAVARVVPRKGVRDGGVSTRHVGSALTLLSAYSMSPTTGRHISYLGSASPFRVVYVPLKRGRGWIEPEDVRDGFLDAFERLVPCLNTADNRREFARLMACRGEILRLACEKWAKPLRDRRFRKYETMDVGKMAKELQERNRRLASKRAAETRALFARSLPKARASGADYCEFVHVLCDGWYGSEKFPFSDEQRSRLRAKLDRNAAYVWPEGDQIRTSKGVSVPVDEARVLLKAWAAGKDMRAMRVSDYTIVRYEGNTIQIGCHRIPRENMLALYEAVVGERFPERGEASNG